MADISKIERKGIVYNVKDAIARSGLQLKYTKPIAGIPKEDMSPEVQYLLDLAKTALQRFTESDPTVPNHVKSIKQQDITNWNNKLSSFVESDPTVSAHVKAITQQDISNWNSKTSNIGTITGITMNGVSKGTSGVINLGTVITAHQSLNGYATTQYVDRAIGNLVGSAPTVLDTLEELAAALGEDKNFSTTITNALGNKVEKESGKSLMTDAEHTKLAGIATGAEVNVNADWNAISGAAQILNKPTLFSGNYNDLTNKPSIPSAYDDTALSDRVAALEGAGFLTTETDPTIYDWAKQPNKPTYTAQEVGALPADTVIPTVPTNISAFNNDAGYLTSYTETDPTVPQWAKSPTKPVYTANEVGALPNTTHIPADPVNADWNASSGLAQILNKPTLFSGDYNDLRNKPVIPESVDLTGYATTDDVDAAVAALVSSAPQTLDTLKELADALGDDPNFATTVSTALGNKVDKVSGKVLSSNDYTTADKNKLAGIAEGAEVNVNADWNATSGDAKILNKPNLFSGDYNDLTNKPTIPTAYDDTELSNRIGAVETGLQSKAEANAVYTKSDVDTKTAKTTARGDNKLLYNGQTIDAAIANVGISTSNNLLNNGFNMAIRSNSTNPFFGLKEGNNLWYAQAASNYFYFGPTSTNAFRLDQAGNGVFQTGSVTANSFIKKNGTAAQFLKADGSVDSNTYLTQHQDVSGKVNYTDLASVATSGSYNDLTNKPTIPAAYNDTALSNRIAALENAGFITNESDPTVPAWAKATTKPSYTASEVGALPDTTVIPTATSQLTNDSGFLTSHQDISGKQDVLTAGDGIAIDNTDTIRTIGIPYGKVDSTSTSTVFTATVPGIDRLEDGVCVLLKNGVVTSAKNFTININGLGAKHCYTNMAAATMESTIFNVNYTMLFVYDSTRVTGGGWICYRGYDSDTNTNTVGYLLRGNNSTMKTTDASRYYKIFFTSADGTHWVPASVNSTNNATSARPVNQRPIDPFGRIMYTSANTNYPAGSIIAVATLWSQYPLSLGYSFNRTGAELTLTASTPVYVKCTPQTDGSAIIDADVPYVQALPTTNDGKIYIFLGIAYNATNIELYNNHPVYYHDGTGIRLWTGSTGGGGDLSNYYTKTEVDTALSGKQATLVSGTNIKTINNESLLGSGNISIQGGSGSANIEYNSSKTALVIGGGSTKYTISLSDGDVILSSVEINDFTYSASRFPLEVNSGDILNIVISMGPGTCTTTMGGTTVSTSTSFSIQSVSGNIVITVNAPGGGPSGPGGPGGDGPSPVVP